jgi:hypothetical protein
MAEYIFGTPEISYTRTASFEEFMGVVKGSSIVSMADWSNDRIELGLSGSRQLRVSHSDGRLQVNVFSTANPEDPIAIPLSLGEMPQRVQARLVEKKLRGLRMAYAILFLIEVERFASLEHFIAIHPYGDIETRLLAPEERLQIESISYGSWIVNVWVRSKAGVRALGNVVTLAFGRSREAWLRTLENKARLTGAEADLKEVEAARAGFELSRERIEYALSAIKRFESSEVREEGERRLREALFQLASGNKGEREVRRLIRSQLPDNPNTDDGPRD